MTKLIAYIILLASTINIASAQAIFEVRKFTYDKASDLNGYELPGKLKADWYCSLSSVTFVEGHSKGPASVTVWIHDWDAPGGAN